MKIVPPSRRIGVLLSGRGSNFMAIADRIESGSLDAEIALVISNKETAPGLAEARRRGLEAVYLPSAGRSREEFDQGAVDRLRERNVSLVCLAGFMRLLGPVFVRAFPNAILNIHPALLPAFPGLDVQGKALEHGVRFSGCTVHLVDESLDGGPIVRQAVVPVLVSDSADDLSARILEEEHRIYSEAIGVILDGRCEIDGRRVIVRDSNE
jgi:phosphoribosylglycinamide formyltransferase-1